MSVFGEAIDSILIKPARDWTQKESLTIDKLMKESGRPAVQQALIEVRGGEKPQSE
jgi:hypothetical protein